MSKGSRSRVENTRQFYENWEKIFGTTNKKEGSRESIRIEYTESDNPLEGGAAYFQKGGMQYAEYSIQYHAPTENN